MGFLLLVLPCPANAETTQAGAQGAAANTNQKGSDDDIDEATSNGMQALMNLAALNIPGAFSKGYEAYGNYINSTKLDDLEAKTKSLGGAMASVGSSGVSGSSSSSSGSDVSGTVFKKKVDSAFLQKGKAGIIAAEFEKRTGMSRDELLQHFNSAVDAQLNYNDPELLNKLEQRFHAFRDRIPNKDFREGLEKAENLFPTPLKNKALGEIMEFYQSSVSGAKADPKLASGDIAAQKALAPAASATPGANAPKPADSAASAASEGNPEANRALASAAKTTDPSEGSGRYLGLSAKADALNDFVNAANLATENTTIFTIVSLRYRKLTPRMVSATN